MGLVIVVVAVIYCGAMLIGMIFGTGKNERPPTSSN
jgi:hypothetical protein